MRRAVFICQEFKGRMYTSALGVVIMSKEKEKKKWIYVR